MATTLSYGERLLRHIMDQCELRGIPVEESESFMAHLKEEHGKSVTDMDTLEMKRVQQELDKSFREYLGGSKRRPGVVPEAWPAATGSAMMAAAKAGIAIADITGTGKNSQVTVADVEQAVADRDAE